MFHKDNLEYNRRQLGFYTLDELHIIPQYYWIMGELSVTIKKRQTSFLMFFFILSWTEVRLFLMSLSILCEYYELLF